MTNIQEHIDKLRKHAEDLDAQGYDPDLSFSLLSVIDALEKSIKPL